MVKRDDITPELLKSMVDEGLSKNQIATGLNTTYETILTKMKKYNISMNEQSIFISNSCTCFVCKLRRS